MIKCYRCGKPGHKSPKCRSKYVLPDYRQSSQSAQYLSDADDSFAASYTAIQFTSYTGSENNTTENRDWILDSGCTAHLCGDEGNFESMSTSEGGKINLACHATSDIKGKGSVKIPVSNNEKRKLIRLQNTLYVPDLRTNLVSVSRITDRNHIVTFTKNSAVIVDENGQKVLTAERRGDLYYLNKSINHAGTAEFNSQAQTLHNRLGHLNLRDLMKLNECTNRLQLNDKEKESISKCDICARGKMVALPFPKRGLLCSELLAVIHSDVVGPMRTQAVNGAKWFVTFIDDCSRWCEVYFLKEKGGVYEAFKSYQSFVERQTGMKIKCVQSDRGREYCNKEFDRLFANQGIERRLTVARTPQQNGVAERMNRTLIDMARCLMLQANIQSMFWAEAIATACHIRNRCPSSALDWKTPYEKWKGQIPNINYLRTFGVPVYVLNKYPTREKFTEKTISGIFVGYPRETKGYRIWLPEQRKFIIARDVKFQETSPNDSTNVNESINVKENIEDKNIKYIDANQRKSSTPKLSPESDQTDTPGSTQSEPNNGTGQRRGRGRPKLLRTGAPGRPRKLFQSVPEIPIDEIVPVTEEDDDVVFVGAAEVSLHEAMSSPEHEEWEKAILSEVENLVRNNTLVIVKKPEGQNLVGSRVVLTNKCDLQGNIEKRKARIVAKGYSQRFGVDYHQTFAPVARLESVRLLLALSAQFQMEVRQFDVVTAYLNGILDEEVYMEIPDMFPKMLQRITQQNKSQELKHRAEDILKQIDEGGNSCRLLKALYGLRQAGRKWHETLSQKLTEMDLQPTKNEPCMYHARRNGNLLLLIIYVDDLLIASSDTAWIEEIKSNLAKSFDLKDLGLAKHCLGLEITQENAEITLTQTGYINDVLNRYGMNKCNPVMTPAEVKSSKTNIDTNISLNSTNKRDSEDSRTYRELIGSLMYISVGTRPDISNTISRLAQHVNEPKPEDFKSAKRVLRYLSGTKTLGLKYTRSEHGIIGYSDTD